MRYAYVLLASLFACVSLSAQSKAAPEKIDASSLWQLPAQFMTKAHAACEKQSGSNYGNCVIGQMAGAGAPANAVRFTRELLKQSHGEFGVMTGFQDAGLVAFAWITYPLRANTNYGFLLLNGQPRIVNLEDLKLLDVKTMKQSSQFQDAKRLFPKVGVWPGDRDGKIWPNSQPGQDGGVAFTVAYPLRNGCHACANAGQAIFNWNFAASGKVLGTSFQGMIDPPLQ